MGSSLDQVGSRHAGRFDWVADGRSSGPLPTFDEPLVADADAVAVPSLGSLVQGWTLLVPRVACISLRQLGREGRNRLEPVRETVIGAHRRAWPGSRIYEFEHGPDSHGSLVGCGVDHAHLHIVPLSFDLAQACLDLPYNRASFDANAADPWQLLPPRGDYIIMRDVLTGVGMILVQDKPVSQVIRKVVADRIGRSGDWDYRSNDGHENAVQTRLAFREYGAETA